MTVRVSVAGAFTLQFLKSERIRSRERYVTSGLMLNSLGFVSATEERSLATWTDRRKHKTWLEEKSCKAMI
jgi:hypothetical protein